MRENGFRIYFHFWEKSLTIWEKMVNFRIFPSSFYMPNNTRAKKVDVIFTFKHSLLNFRTNYETMDFVLVLGPDIQDTDIQAPVKKNWEFFLKKNQVFLAEKRRRLTWWRKLDWYKKSPRPCYLSWWRMVSVSFVSVEKYELQMRKNFRNVLHPFFCPESAVGKNFDVIF